MPSSGVTAWSLTARDLITQALRELGVLSSGEEPTSDELSDCLVRLVSLLKSLQAKGANLWRESIATATITANVASVALAAGVRDVVAARLVGISYNRPLAQWERDDYRNVPNRAQAGDPIAYYVEQAVGSRTLYVWPVPTTGKTLELDVIRQVETITDASQTLDFPEEHQEALYTALAVRCAGLFGVQPGPELVARAQQLEREMLDADRPESYFMGPWSESHCA
jgi:hypothetical protein